MYIKGMGENEIVYLRRSSVTRSEMTRMPANLNSGKNNLKTGTYKVCDVLREHRDRLFHAGTRVERGGAAGDIGWNDVEAGTRCTTRNACDTRDPSAGDTLVEDA
jgi:hypothetical protein